MNFCFLMEDFRRKVFSVQVGPHSNFVSSLFWNAIVVDGENRGSYFFDSKPVALCVDSKDAEMCQANTNVKVELKNVPWSGETAVFDRRINESKETWSSIMSYDYYDVKHSFHKLEDVRIGITPFEKFSDGLDRKDEDLEDVLRYWSECCDSIEKFRVLWDVNSGFSGVAKQVVDYITDEHRKCDILAFPVELAERPEFSSENHLMSLYYILDDCKMYIPLSSLSWDETPIKEFHLDDLSEKSVCGTMSTFLRAFKELEHRYPL